jgi:hypothetical protein
MASSTHRIDDKSGLAEARKTGKPTKSEGRYDLPKHIWLPGLALCSLTLFTVIAGLFYELFLGILDNTACTLLNIVVSFCAGFAAYFMGGGVEIRWRSSNSKNGMHRLGRAFGGVATFLLVWFNPPFNVHRGSAPAIHIDNICGSSASSAEVLGGPSCEVDGHSDLPEGAWT